MSYISPRKFYQEHIGPSILRNKKNGLKEVWEQHVAPQISDGTFDIPSNFNFDEYLDSIRRIEDLPLNKRIERLEMELYTHLDIMPELEQSIFRHADDIYVASYPSHVSMASAYKCSDRSFLILLNDGLINLLRSTTIWSVKLWKAIEDGDWESLIADIKMRASRYLVGYRKKRELIEDYLLAPDMEELHVGTRIVDSCIKFLIAHELGHIASNHFRPDQYKPKVIYGYSVGEYQRNRVREYEADDFALHLLSNLNLEYFEKEENDFLAAGVLLLFLTMDLMEFVMQEKIGGTQTLFEERSERIITYLEDHLPDHLELAIAIEDSFTKIFNDFEIEDDCL